MWADIFPPSSQRVQKTEAGRAKENRTNYNQARENICPHIVQAKKKDIYTI